MTVIAGRLATTYPDSNTGWGARVIAAQEQLVTTVRPALLLISGGRRLPAADRLRQRRQPDPGAALEPARRDRGARGARRRTPAARAPGAGRKLRAVGGSAARSACSWPGPASASCTRCPKAACRGCRTCASTAACCSSRCVVSVGVALVFGLVPAIQASRAGLRDTMNAFSGTTRHSGGRAAQRARRRRGRARADAARRRRPDDPQLRAADARLAGVRAGQSPRGADLPAAGEIQDRPRSHALLHGRDPPRRRAARRAVGGRRQRAADVPGRHRLRAAVHDRRAGGADQRRGAARRHPHRHARLFRDDEDRAAQGAVHRRAAIVRARPAPSSSTRRWRGAISPARIRSARSCATRTARARSSASSATSSTTASTASRGPSCSCRRGSSR